MFLKIENEGSIERICLEIFGVTTKDVTNQESIGYKGSGTKLASVGALRLGLDIAIASSDSQGEYILKYEAVPIRVAQREFNQIRFRYEPISSQSAVIVRDSSMVIEAFKDWDKPIGDDDKRVFKVVRELLCNAWDARKGFRLSYVDDIAKAKKGCTAAYLVQTPEILEIFAHVERYFKFIFSVSARESQQALCIVKDIGSIYPKSEPDKTRLFVQGVLVHCDKAPSQYSLYDYSLYDYSHPDKTLVSEERIIKSMGAYQHKVAKLFSHMTDQVLARAILESAESGTAKFEEQVFAYVGTIKPEAKKIWLAALHELHGAKVAITSENEHIDADCRQIYGYTVLGKNSDNLQHFYSKLGVARAQDIVPNKNTMIYEIVSFEALTPACQRRFMRAFKRFARHFPERAKIPIVFYFPLGDKMRRLAGFAGIGKNVFKEIWIATLTRTTLNSSEEDIYMTLLHESRHCITEAGDYERAFIDCADKDNQQLAFHPFGTSLQKIQPNFIVPTEKEGPIGPTYLSDTESQDIDVLWESESDIDPKLPP